MSCPPAAESPPVTTPLDRRPQAASKIDRRKTLSRILALSEVGVRLRDAVALVQPFGKKEQPADHIYESGRNPHNQAGCLLVFQRRQTPSKRRGSVGRIPNSGGKGQQRAENACMDCSGKQIKHARAVTDL